MDVQRLFDILRERGVAHRGLHGPLAYQNSPLAFRLAKEWGYPFETDVHLSKDGKLYLNHDHDLIYQAGEKGVIEDMTEAEISRYRLPDGAPLLTLGELLSMVEGAVPIVIELKAYKGNGPELARKVKVALASYQGPAAIISFNQEALLAYGRGREPLGALIGGDELPKMSEEDFAKFDFLDVAYPLLDDRKIANYRAKGGKVLSWTIRNEEQLALSLSKSDAVTFENFRPFKAGERVEPGYYPASIENTMNGSMAMAVDLPDDARLLEIAGASEYQCFLNGDFLLYGPERGAKGRFYVDEALLKGSGPRRLSIFLTGSNAKGYERVNEKPFLFYRIYDERGNILRKTSTDDRVYVSPFRLEKVARFSYQRAFSESYRMDYGAYKAFRTPGMIIDLPSEPLAQVGEMSLYERRTHYPRYERYVGTLLEGGRFEIDPSLPVWDDRSMHAPFLGMYEKKDWEVAPSDYVSQCVYHLGTPKNSLSKGDFLTYGLTKSKTGFPVLRLRVYDHSVIDIVFDEADTSDEPGPIGIDFKRNGTHNILHYDLTPGTYELTGFIPVSGKYFRLLVEEGWVEPLPNAFEVISLENPDATRLAARIEDSELSLVFEAARESFRQCAVDVLMDCPSRERAGWLCDTYFTARAEALLTGENAVEKAFLDDYAHYVNRGDQPPKMIPMCHPSDYGDQGYIPNWPMFYVLELLEAKKRNQRTLDLEGAYKKIAPFLEWCESFRDEEGFLENVDGVVFVEWSHANDLESTRGVNFPTNMLYERMLEALSELYPERLGYLKERARGLRKAIMALGYDGKWWNDNAMRNKEGKLVLTGRVSEVTQYYAFHFGFASKEKDPELYERVFSLLGPKRSPKVSEDEVFPANMFIGYYLRLSSLLKEGEFEKVLDEARIYFGKMALRTGTLWEYDSYFASLTHGFASFAANIIVECLSGVYLIDEVKKVVHRRKGKRVAIKCRFDIPVEGGARFLTYERKEKGEALFLPEGYALVED